MLAAGFLESNGLLVCGMRGDNVKILDSKTLNQIDQFDFGAELGSAVQSIAQVGDWSIAISGQSYRGLESSSGVVKLYDLRHSSTPVKTICLPGKITCLDKINKDNILAMGESIYVRLVFLFNH